MTMLVKDPDAELDYALDWADWLSDSETISAASWSSYPDGLTLAGDAINDSVTSVLVSGGSFGAVHALRCRVTTSLGRKDDRTLTLRIQHR